MIKYSKNNEGQPIDSNSNVVFVDTSFAIVGNEIWVFETVTEKEGFISSISQEVWSKGSYSQQVNDAHTQLYNDLWLAKGYMSEAEIKTWADTLKKDALSVAWKAEAKAILNWFCETTIIVYKYLDDVNEQTAIPVDEFIQTLPAL